MPQAVGRAGFAMTVKLQVVFFHQVVEHFFKFIWKEQVICIRRDQLLCRLSVIQGNDLRPFTVAQPLEGQHGAGHGFAVAYAALAVYFDFKDALARKVFKLLGQRAVEIGFKALLRG